MKLVGIDVGKNSHHFCVMDKETGEFNVAPSSFSNNKEGFDFLINSLEYNGWASPSNTVK